jgi:ribonuclease HI
MVYEKALNIYVDGSSFSHPRRGGIGIRYVTIDKQGSEVVQSEDLPGHESATNNEMELLAAIKGLNGAGDHPAFEAVERICVFTVLDVCRWQCRSSQVPVVDAQVADARRSAC